MGTKTVFFCDDCGKEYDGETSLYSEWSITRNGTLIKIWPPKIKTSDKLCYSCLRKCVDKAIDELCHWKNSTPISKEI